MRILIVQYFTLIIKIIAFFYDIITFPLYYYIQKPWMVLNMSQLKKGAKSFCNDQLMWTTMDTAHEISKELEREGLDTMASTMDYYAKKYPNRNCLGSRKIISQEEEIQPNGSSLLKLSSIEMGFKTRKVMLIGSHYNKIESVSTQYNMGEFNWKTYAQINVMAIHFAKGILELGVSNKNNVAIFAETREEWMIAAHGLFKQSIPIVTIYATLGEEGIIHAINETEVSIVITSSDLLTKFVSILKKVIMVDTIIYFEDPFKPFELIEFGCKGGYRFLKFSDVVKLGAVSKLYLRMPSCDDTAIIMYTSGSTGIPKGVILTHSNIMATMKAFSDCTNTLHLVDDDCLLGFLPLAHIFEMVVECVCLCSGVRIGYSNPNTLIDSSTKIKRGSAGDASVLHPTVMTSVPLIMDRLAKAVREKVNKTWLFKQILFKFGYDYKVFWCKRGYSTPIIDTLVFRKIRKMLGGKLRIILCGGAPLSIETQEFIETCLSVHIINGYGLTETTACATVMNGYDKSLGRVGGPTTCTKIKLVDWVEGNYFITDKPNPRGEIHVGGKNVSPGYYKLVRQTNEDFYIEHTTRWFRTGDIGEMHRDGCLKIIDRKKDLVKLISGEYISLGKIETELKTVSIVDNICIAVYSHMSYCIGLISPNHNALLELGASLQINTQSVEELCSSPIIQEAVLKIIQEHCKNKKMEKGETPGAIKLCNDPWTPNSGLVTSAFKLRRIELYKFYRTDIDEIYKTTKVS